MVIAMSAVFSYLIRMAPFVLAAAPVFALIRFLLIRSRKKAGIPFSAAHEFWLFVFAAFLIGLASLTVFPVIRLGVEGLTFHLYGRGGVNLIPFQIFGDSARRIQQGDTDYFLINFAGNIAMFLPLGFFPRLLFRGMTPLKTVTAGFGASLFIELCQIPLQRGTDIDDLWLNTLGALLGVLCYRLLERTAKGFCARCKLPSPE